MSEVISPSVSFVRAPTVGFVSLGCPKALTDSELILTQLSAEGYQTSKTFQGADLVIVNTCGFIDDAVKESLDTIGEALAENGRGDRDRLLGRQVGRQRRQHGSENAPEGSGSNRPACDARGDGRGSLEFAQTPRSLLGFGAAAFWHCGHQTHTPPLRLFKNQRRLQPPLHLLHYSLYAW